MGSVSSKSAQLGRNPAPGAEPEDDGVFRVANACPDTVQVMISTDRQSEHTLNRDWNFSFGGGIPRLKIAQLEMRAERRNTASTRYEEFIEEGFCAVPPGGLKTFRGRLGSTQVVFLSIKVRGTGEVIAHNASQPPQSTVIVTPESAVVDAVSWYEPWISVTNHNYRCQECMRPKPCQHFPSTVLPAPSTSQHSQGTLPANYSSSDQHLEQLVAVSSSDARSSQDRCLIAGSVSDAVVGRVELSYDYEACNQIPGQTLRLKVEDDATAVVSRGKEPYQTAALESAIDSKKELSKASPAQAHHPMVTGLDSNDGAATVLGHLGLNQLWFCDDKPPPYEVEDPLLESEDQSSEQLSEKKLFSKIEPDSETSEDVKAQSGEALKQRCVVIHGLAEEQGEDLEGLVKCLFEEMHLPALYFGVKEVERLGQLNPTKNRPVKVEFEKNSDAQGFKTLSSSPRHRIKRTGVYVTEYRTPKKMKEYHEQQNQEALEERKKKKRAKPDAGISKKKDSTIDRQSLDKSAEEQRKEHFKHITMHRG